jgi:Dynein heavy chain AAA lid domain
MDALLPDDLASLDTNHIECAFLFSSVWSFGACLEKNDRDRF